MVMLSQSQRTAILELHRKGVGNRQIARALRVSRAAVKKVIRSQSSVPPPIPRPEKAEPYRQEILDLYTSCQGNLVRVHEELLATGASLSYPALTAFCRRHGIGQKPAPPAGRYDFEPGVEAQFDTSPHKVRMAGSLRPVQTASKVLCYSRMLFFQFYPTFQRFDCKVFLTEALKFFDGATATVMIDNTSVVVLRGTGADMIPVPEMAAFGERYGFEFRAHRVGHANRSGRVERPFHFIEKNFLAGREFADWNDLNQQARAWCDRVNGTYKKHIRAIPRELFAVERPHLKPLPIWVPEVYRLHHRIVDVEGYVAVKSNRYSVPVDWIGRQVEVRETRDRIDIQCGLRQSVSHERLIDSIGKRVTLKVHRPARGLGIKRTDPRPEEKTLGQVVPEITDYVTALKKSGRKYITLALRQLVRMAREYPRDAFLSAVTEAAHYGLYDLDRLERMILRRIANEYFQLDNKNR
jgi:transposase